MPSSEALVRVEGLVKHFPVPAGRFPRGARVRAVEDVGFEIRRGEVLALVGESGSGKSTVGKLLLRLIEPTSGRITFDGTPLTDLGRRSMRTMRRRMQMIFQDPYSSLNPHLRIGAALEEPLLIHGLSGDARKRRDRVAELLQTVGLPESAASRYPHEFSGGQRQRIGIARALAVEPEFIVADEAISALDVSNQAQVLNVLSELRQRSEQAMLFISHNMAVVRNFADRVAVLYLGRLMEIAPAESLFRNPRHPYTAALLDAVPVPDPLANLDKQLLQGDIPSPIDPPSGCVFRSRCPRAIDACAAGVPPLQELGPGHRVACIRSLPDTEGRHAA